MQYLQGPRGWCQFWVIDCISLSLLHKYNPISRGLGLKLFSLVQYALGKQMNLQSSECFQHTFGTLYTGKVNAKRIKNFISLGIQYAFQNGRNFCCFYHMSILYWEAYRTGINEPISGYCKFCPGSGHGVGHMLIKRIQGWAKSLGQRFSACFILKLPPQRGEGEKREGVHIL